MTRLARDLTGEALAKALAILGYLPTRQTGSHMRLTTPEHGEHHEDDPDEDRVDTESPAESTGPP